MSIGRTPLRISLVGGGADLPAFYRRHGGAVLSTAIDKYIYHTVSHLPSWLFDHKIRFAYRKVEHVRNLDELEHRPFREILRYCGVERDVEVNLASDLPSFSGLGSSSSFTVGLLKGLNAYRGKHIGQEQLARAAIEVEREVLREVVGLQDQIFAAYGGLNIVQFRGQQDFYVERVPLGNGAGALADLIGLEIERHPHTEHVPRMWELRHNLSAYDAVYIALAEALDAPLVTADGRIAQAPGHDAAVEVF